jgi:hypothetical protein
MVKKKIFYFFIKQNINAIILFYFFKKNMNLIIQL